VIISKAFRFLDKYTSTKQKVYIIPSKTGFVFIGILFTLFLIGLTYTNNITLLISFIMTTFLLQQMFETHAAIQSIIFTSIDLQNMHANEALPFHCKFPHNYQKDLSVFADFEVSISLHNDKDDLKGILDLSNASDTKMIGRFNESLKRGRYNIHRCMISSIGTSGLFYVWRNFNLKQDLYIFPKTRYYTGPQVKTILDANSINNNSDFMFHIPYTTGLSTSRIDWKLMAKRDQIFWKKHSSELEGNIIIKTSDLDTNTERQIEKACYLVGHAFKHNLTWSLQTHKELISDCNSFEDVQTCFKHLSVL